MGLFFVELCTVDKGADIFANLDPFVVTGCCYVTEFEVMVLEMLLGNLVVFLSFLVDLLDSVGHFSDGFVILKIRIKCLKSFLKIVFLAFNMCLHFCKMLD